MYIRVILSKYLKPNMWPKSGPLALNGVLLVAQKWPVGKKGVNSVSCFGVGVSARFHFMFDYFIFSSVWVAEWPLFGK